MLPDDPKYPQVRSLKDRAFEALLRALRIYWDHIAEHKCRRAASPAGLPMKRTENPGSSKPRGIFELASRRLR